MAAQPQAVAQRRLRPARLQRRAAGGLHGTRHEVTQEALPLSTLRAAACVSCAHPLCTRAVILQRANEAARGGRERLQAGPPAGGTTGPPPRSSDLAALRCLLLPQSAVFVFNAAAWLPWPRAALSLRLRLCVILEVATQREPCRRRWRCACSPRGRSRPQGCCRRCVSLCTHARTRRLCAPRLAACALNCAAWVSQVAPLVKLLSSGQVALQARRRARGAAEKRGRRPCHLRAPRLTPPLPCPSHLQQNAAAALSGLCGGVPGAREALAAEGGACAVVSLLSPTTPPLVRANALETAGVLSAGGGMGMDALLVAGVQDAVVGACAPPHPCAHLSRALTPLGILCARAALLAGAETSPHEAEAAADVLCTLAAEAAARVPLVTAGAVPCLCALLHHGNSELRVRALLCLGMLVAERSAATALVASTQAMQRLRALASALQTASDGPDGDEAMLSADVLTALLRDPELGAAAAAAAGVAAHA